MSFTAPRFTDEGKALQAKAQAGTALKFTKMQLGDGELGSQAIAAMTKLINPLITLDIRSIKAGNNYAAIKSNFSNSGISTGFYWREIGVFAADPEKPNDRNSDILYCYANAGSLAEYIPAAGSEIIEKVISVPCIIGDAENVSASVKSEIYVSKADLDEHINNKNNPHGVTAEQIGALTDTTLTKTTILNKIGILDIAHGGTGKTTADEAFGNLGKNFGFPNAKNIGDNTDLNTLTKAGFYFSAGSKNATNTTNIPQLVYDTVNTYYELNILVFGLANRVTQIAVYPYNNSSTLYEKMWVRTGIGTSVDSLSWSGWKEIFNSKQYIPVANGGTDAGTADTARKNLNAQRRIAQYVSGEGADLDTDVFDFIVTTLTNTKHKTLRDLGFGNFAYVWQYFYSGASNTTNRVQFAKGYITDKFATRYYNSSTSKWSEWTLIITSENLQTNIQNLLKGGSISVVKSVQKGTVNLSGNVSTSSATHALMHDVTINSINTNKTMLLINGQNYTSGNAGAFNAFGRIKNSTTITFGNTYVGSTGINNVTYNWECKLDWQVIEFY